MAENIYENIKANIGTNIRRTRKLYKYTIEDLAEIIGISSPYLGLVERGKRKLAIDKILCIMEVFDLKFEELAGEGIKSESKIEYDRKLLSLTTTLDDEKKAMVFRTVKAIVHE